MDPLSSRGQFDHRYDAEGLIKIPSDGKLHRIAVLCADGTPQLRLITVPRERADVYREAELINPWHADGMLPSLLRGTVALERFIEDRFAVMLRYLIILNTRLI